MSEDTPSKAPWWIIYVKEFGLPSVLAGILLFGGWKITEWAGTNIIKPMIEDQRESSKELRESFKFLTNNMESIGQELKQNGEHIRKIQTDVSIIKDKLTIQP
jgi:hypothetical protein